MGDQDWGVTLSPQVYEALRRLAERKGVSVLDMLTYALSLGKAATEAQLEGSRLLIETRGHVVELVM